jgi:hypothetical protein
VSFLLLLHGARSTSGADNLQAAHERALASPRFLCFEARFLAAAIVFTAVEERFEVVDSFPLPVDGFQPQMVHAETFTEELCDALEMDEVRCFTSEGSEDGADVCRRTFTRVWRGLGICRDARRRRVFSSGRR